MELCLGTVQLGMNYGIRGQKQPSIDESMRILDYATHNGITSLDTANAYGTAEDVVGKFISGKYVSRNKLFIISKFRPNMLDDVAEDNVYSVMRDNLTLSLTRLNTDYLDSYLLHSARYIYNPQAIDAMDRLKREGYVRGIGVSVYEPEEAFAGMENKEIDFIQLPYSIFDQRMQQSGVFERANSSDVMIHSRSAFIQGLILMQEEEVPDFLMKAKPIIKKIDVICKRNNVSRIELAMHFVKKQERISHLVFGVDSIEQLKQDISIFSEALFSDVIDEIGREFTNISPDIVMPSLWSKK